MPRHTKVRLGHASTPPVVAVTKPSASNTGYNPALIDGTLTGTQSITTPGTTIENKIINGQVQIRTSNVTIRNCLLTGSATAAMTVVYCDYAGISNALIEHCTILPAVRGTATAGFHGHGYTARYCDVSEVVDGFGTFTSTSYTTTPANVTIEYNYVHDLLCLLDPARSDGITHSDCWQHHGNGGVTVRYNNFQAFPSADSDADVGGMSCCMVTPDDTKNPAPNILIDSNWFDGGMSCVNVNPVDATDTVTSVTVTNNLFGRLGSRSGGRDVNDMTYRILANRYVTVPGLPAVTGLDTANGNVFEDTGTPITVVRK